MVMLYPYVLMMEFRLFSVQSMRHVMNTTFMINTNIFEPLYMTVMMVASQKRWPVMRGKINMICKEWKWTEFHKFSETFLAFPEGFQCTCSIHL